jgi:outer membrane protein assembly factor BamC
MKFSFLRLTLLLVLGASGCSLSGEKPEPQGKLRETLEVPPDLARPQSGDLSVGVPGATAVHSASNNKTPETLPKDAQAASIEPTAPAGKPVVRLERDGMQRWLVVQELPDGVAARVRSHLVSRNMGLEIDDPKSGIFETEWKERKINLGTNVLTRMLSSMQSTGLRDKYRIRIESGRVAGTSEVTVSHLGLEEVLTGDIGVPNTTWQPRATDFQAEAELLSALMTSFGMSEQETKDQVGKVAVGSTRKTSDGLLLQQHDMDAAWRRAGQALDRSGFVVEDRDRHLGVFYVYDRPVPGVQKKGGQSGGWLSFGEKEVQEDRFQVVLKTVDGGTSLKVLNVKGEPPESRSGERLLDYLQKQLQ